MNVEVSRREKFKAVFGALALAMVVFLLAPPIAEAAKQQVVKVKGNVNVKVKDTTGDEVESKAVADMGELGAPGSAGALAVRTFAGGTGFLGTGDCTADAEASRPNTTTVEAGADTIITGIIITGPDAKVSVSAPDLNALIGPFPVANFQTTADNQNVFVGLGNGLTVFPSELVFTCTGADGGNGQGDYVILGQ